MRVAPWWVITVLDSDGIQGEMLEARLNAHLSAWSRTNDVEPSDRWWRVDALRPDVDSSAEELVDLIDGFLYNPLRRVGSEAAPRIGGPIEADRLNIAVVGDIRCHSTRTAMQGVARVLRMRSGDLFAGVSTTTVGLLFLPNDRAAMGPRSGHLPFLSDLTTALADPAGSRPFDAIVPVQDGNVSASNPHGYSDLCDRDAADLLVQVLVHLAIGGLDRVIEIAIRNETGLVGVGSAAVYFDERAARMGAAHQIATSMLDCFSLAAEDPFVRDAEAEAACDEIAPRLTIAFLFGALSKSKDRPEFTFDNRIWERAKDAAGSVVEAWQFWRAALFRVYFARYVRFLPLRLSEYARLFLTARLETLRQYLGQRSEGLLGGSRDDPGLRGKAVSAWIGVLAGSFGRARSLGQAREVVERLRQLCDPGPIGAGLASVEGFGRLEVFAIPRPLRDAYDEAPAVLTHEEEVRRYGAVAGLLERHPSPLALLARAALLGVGVAFVGQRVLDRLSPTVVDLEWFLRIDGVALVVLGLIPLVAATWRYFVTTLASLRRRLREYVAAVLRHAQTRARALVEREIRRIYAEILELCDEFDLATEAMASGLECPAPEPSQFEPTTFLVELGGPLTVPNRPPVATLEGLVIDWVIDVGGEHCQTSAIQDGHRLALLCEWLEARSPAGGHRVWESLSDELPNPPSDASIDAAARAAFELLDNCLAKSPNRSLDEWFFSNQNSARQRAIEGLRTLAAPPLTLSSDHGNAVTPVYEWLYESPEHIPDDDSGVTRSLALGRGLLSLSSVAPLESFRALATVRALGRNLELVDEDARAGDVSRIVTLATRSADAPDALSVLDGRNIALTSNETREIAAKLRAGFVRRGWLSGLDEERNI